MVGIKDVAKHAGVALGTVSRVINNNPTVNPQIREKVLKSIEELNFVPNEVARSFKLKTTKIVAFLVPSIHNPFFSELAFYVEDELDRRGYKLLLCNSGGRPEKEQYYLEMLQQNKVAGILGISYNEHEDQVNKDIPFVSIDRVFSNGVPCVTSDNFEGGRIAASKLIEAGCKKIAYVGNYTNLESEVYKRKDGFMFEAKQQGIDFVIYEKEEPIEDINEFFMNFYQQHNNVDGVFANPDLLAATFIKFLKTVDKNVPEDVKVIGYDGIQDNDLFHPILSTIRQPVEEIAALSVEILLKKINNEPVISHLNTIPVKYKKGETV